jgi:N-dimethylarginine dimethylaminohydrolase
MRLLMCPPDYFDVTYEINAWMRIVNGPNIALAQRQWRALHAILSEEVGADVSLVTPQPGLPDMVFTANAGITQDDLFIPSRFRFAERQGEVPYFIEWFQGQGFRIEELPPETRGSFEGEGDALFYGTTLLAGYRQRSDASAYRALAQMLNCQVLPLELVDTRWYHLDTCLIPVGPDLLAYYPPAFDSYANTVLENLPGDKILLTEHDALRFGGNAVVAGDHVVMNAGCEALAEALLSRGYVVHATDLSEFLKSGGSAKCLTLVLDH